MKRAASVVAEEPADLRRWLAILVLAAAGFSLGADLYMLPALVPAIARDLGVGVGVAGQLLTIYGVLVAVCAPLLTVVTARVDRKFLMAASLALLVVTEVITAMAPNLAWLALTRVLAAASAAVLAPIRTATAGQLAPPQARARAVAIATAGLSAALVVGAPAGLWIAVAYGWRTAFLAAAALAATVLLGLLVLLPSVPPAGRSELRAQLAVLRDTRILLVLLSNVAALGAIYVLLPFLVPTVQDLTSFAGAALAGVFALYGVAGTVGNGLAGWAADRLGTTRVMLGGLLLSGLAMAALSLLSAWAHRPAADVAVPLIVVLWGWGSWAYYALLFHRLIELAPGAPALAISWSSPATFVGVSLGASLGGLTLRQATTTSLGWVAAFIFVLAAGLVLLASTVSRRAR